MGILIGALAGGICFVLFGWVRAAHAGGISAVVILSKFKGGPAEQSPFDRIVVAAGMIVGVVLGVALSMFLGGIVGGVLEHVLMKMN